VENCISALRFPYKKTLKRRDLAFDDLLFRKQPHELPNWWVFISHAAVHSEVRQRLKIGRRGWDSITAV
jgi:hypothetical protein